MRCAFARGTCDRTRRTAPVFRAFVRGRRGRGADRDRPQRRRQVDASARALRLSAPRRRAAFALEGGDPERTLGEQAHYLGHADALKGALTAGENLAFWAGALGGDGLARRRAARRSRASASPMSIDFPARALSAGQKRRVALARLLVAPRPLWLLDEPTTALDAAAQAAFAAIMRVHLDGGGLIVAATHAPLGLEGARAAAWAAEVRREAALALTPDPSPKGRGGRDPSPSGRRWREAPDEGGGARMTPALALFVREWRIARRIGGGASVGAVFFLILVADHALRARARSRPLARLGPAILWVAALLATLLGLDRLFQADQRRRLARRDDERRTAARARGADQMRGALDDERAAADRRLARSSA